MGFRHPAQIIRLVTDCSDARVDASGDLLLTLTPQHYAEFFAITSPLLQRA